jgi:ubiquinone/menaquinone biosynthesis C-methylase UbiE
MLDGLDANNVLDIGCGDGMVTIPLLSRNRVTFLDFSTGMLELVRRNSERWEERRTIISSSLEDFKPDHSFDVVVCLGFLAHVPDWKEALSKIGSLTKSQGIMILQFSDSEKWLTKVHLILTRRNYRLNRLRPASLLAALNSEGFRFVTERRYPSLLPGMGLLPDWLLHRFSRAAMMRNWQGLETEVIWMLRKE